MRALVGYTGFVGSNIYEAAGNEIDAVYNSKNIEEAYGTNPDLLIYAGLRAEKYLANSAPEKDMEMIYQAEENIKKIDPKKLVLISTIDVFKVPKEVDEDSVIDTENLHAYGYNRYQLELWVREKYPDALIIRLPGLFGKNIKKNFIYDFINVIPFMLKKEKFEELSEKDQDLKRFYTLQENGFYKLTVAEEDIEMLKDKFRKLGFSALNFTDSRSVYQFYNLAHLWKDINTALDAGIKVWHPATEPVSAGEVYEYLTGEKFVNELSGTPADYGYRTVYDENFGGKNGYIADKQSVLREIKDFVGGSKNHKKTIFFWLISVIAILFILYMGPMDGFRHGFYVEEIDASQIEEQDEYDTVDLDNGYRMSFSPEKDYFAGVSIYLKNQPEDNSGSLNMSIKDLNGKTLENLKVDLNDVHDSSWYKVYTSANLGEGETYTLEFSVDQCETVPHLQRVDKAYLPDETVKGDVLISYAYSESTFTLQNKIIISLFMIAVWVFLLGILRVPAKKKYSSIIAVIIFISALLTWNYMYNSMDNQNVSFGEFQADSETLVTGVIYAERDGVWFENADEQGFGLGIYYDLKGRLRGYDAEYITDDNWLNGYSYNEPAIIVNSNTYSRNAAVVGNSIKFKNGDCYQITEISDDGTNITVHLNSERILQFAKYGSLDDITFLDRNGTELTKSGVAAYKSQYGLQGKVFRRLARYMDPDEAVSNLNLICCLATAFVFAIIVVLIFKKYNALMSGCFLVTFWLSPWIVNFARNLYWVEYTWFIPMAVGLFCAWKIDNKKCRIASYIMAFIAIMGKSLCGYEYISVVMMGLISFLLVDFIIAAVKKDKDKLILLFRTIFIIGLVALAGFMAAICIHAPLKGDGSILEGIKNIFVQDVLRRTNGADLNDFAEHYWPSMNASIWEVFCAYFHFLTTEIILGIPGNLFPLICIVPLCIMGYDIKCKKTNYESIVLYVVFFLTSISWFCLAKSHSYIHRHMNYVLWYFGFVQICFYIIAEKITSVFKEMGKKTGEE